MSSQPNLALVERQDYLALPIPDIPPAGRVLGPLFRADRWWWKDAANVEHEIGEHLLDLAGTRAMTGQLRAVPGTAALPGYGFDGLAGIGIQGINNTFAGLIANNELAAFWSSSIAVNGFNVSASNKTANLVAQQFGATPNTVKLEALGTETRVISDQNLPMLLLVNNTMGLQLNAAGPFQILNIPGYTASVTAVNHLVNKGYADITFAGFIPMSRVGNNVLLTMPSGGTLTLSDPGAGNNEIITSA